MRDYPEVQEKPVPVLVPISFVVVHFCDDYYHNILKSTCVQDPINQLITVDNRCGHRYDTLSAAINAGLDQAQHDLIAVVHEDVLLPDGWQNRFQRALDSLEKADPDWGLLGSVGWDVQGKTVGHYSDPRIYIDTLHNRDFATVARLDEQLLIFRKSGEVRFDDMLPSIHNIGKDLASYLSTLGKHVYAINAPTIHKYADQTGKLIQTTGDSPKIMTRELPANLAEWACSDAYLQAKWPQWSSPEPGENNLALDLDVDPFGPPVILLSRGGSGSRLLATLIRDLGIFIGNDVNQSGDAMEMVEAVYRGVLSTYQRRAAWQRAKIVPRLRTHAARMLNLGAPAGPWGYKLPENLLILPQLDQAFPGARFVHLIRDPLSTCLRRTHMTARFDNAIGRTAIRAAYAYCGQDIAQSLEDSPALHMAYTTRHQIETARDYAQTRLQGRYLEIRFEDLLSDPGMVRQAVADWLGYAPCEDALNNTIDPKRAAEPKTIYDDVTARHTAKALRQLRAKLGYPLKPVRS